MKRFSVITGLLAGGTGLLAYHHQRGELKIFPSLPLKGTEAARRHSQELEKKLLDLPLVKKMKADPNLHMLRPWEHIAPDQVINVFTAGTLNAPGALSVPPVVFADDKNKSTYTVFHCGRFVSGFPFLVHGGILSTALDEALHCTASMSVGKYPRESVHIKLSYKRPTVVNQFLVISATTEQLDEGKRARITGSVATLDGKELVRAEADFDVQGSFSWKTMVGDSAA